MREGLELPGGYSQAEDGGLVHLEFNISMPVC